ncbi:cytochrome c family protein [Pseudomonas sp. gcc21]|uniref:c-type cytochrome n=1 Tax=Pseudomonas sp. gcc21 TaxID=2726989 RepID=UPI001C49BD22|nr:c-type cytochrome [Pseudomonas sp. gcc21]
MRSSRAFASPLRRLVKGTRPVRSVMVLLTLAMLAGCPDLHWGTDESEAQAQHGAQLTREYGCGSCHLIPGITGADGLVGPSLELIGRRAYLGGVVPNQPENMVRWLMNPQGADPRTAMPNLGLTEEEARAISAYLDTLK